MTTTKKIKMLLVATVATFLSNNATAQTATTEAEKATNYDQSFRLGFGINGGVPVGFEKNGMMTNDVYDFALGADVRLQYDITKRYSFVLSTGFTNLFKGDDVKDLGFIPAKLGFKAFVWEDQFYVLAEVGGGFAVTNGYTQNTYLWAPGVGYANKNFDLSLRYEDYTEYNTNQIALRLAYGFEL
jgi:hypothetical protein